MNLPLHTTLLALAAAALPAIAQTDSATPAADRHNVSAAAQRDAQGNTGTSAALRLPIGPQGWVQGGLGRTTGRAAGTADPMSGRLVALGAGLVGERWQAGVGVSRRVDGSRRHQQDLTASVDRQIDARWSLGLDLTRRDARDDGDAGSGATADGRMTQRLTGTGAGLRVTVAATERLSVQAAVQKTHYRSSTDTTGGSGGSGLLAGLPTTAERVTVVNREQVARTRSLLLGATARVSDQVTVSGELAQDRLLDGGSLRSAQLQAMIRLGDSGWALAPAAGLSSSSAAGSVGSVALRASRAW